MIMLFGRSANNRNGNNTSDILNLSPEAQRIAREDHSFFESVLASSDDEGHLIKLAQLEKELCPHVAMEEAMKAKEATDQSQQVPGGSPKRF